jgi:hypothetical protein
MAVTVIGAARGKGVLGCLARIPVGAGGPLECVFASEGRGSSGFLNPVAPGAAVRLAEGRTVHFVDTAVHFFFFFDNQ